MQSSISLTANWQFSPDNAHWSDQPALTGWTHTPQSGAVFLRRFVSLFPTEDCVRYVLSLDAAPKDTAVFVNGWHVGTTGDGPFQVNVTDQVALESNLIVLRVSQPGVFGPACLRAVPCP